MKRREFIRDVALSLSLSPVALLSGCQRKLSAEFVIVGSGPAGIALADSLAQAGRQVLVLEGGAAEPDRALQDMHAVEAGKWGLAYNFGWATQRLLGGTTNLWQSHSPRPLEQELHAASLRGVGKDWPFSMDSLTPWLQSAEQWLHVRPSEPAMNPALPVNPFIASSQGLRKLLTGAGYQHLEAGAYGMVHHEGMDALRLLEDGEIDRVAGLNTVALKDRTTVRRIRMSGGRAVALECADREGKPLEVEAGTVILCGGGVQTPRLLWNSASSNGGAAPGNHSDWLGAGFMEHPGQQIYGRREKALLPQGATETHLHVRDMLHDPAYDGIRGTLFHVGLKPGPQGSEFTMVEVLFEQEANRQNRILPGQKTDALGDPLPRVDYRLTAEDRRTIKVGSDLQRQLAEAVGSVDKQTALRPGSHHLMGATRLSLDPRDGVVDANLKVWGTENLYVAGSSVFPSGMTVPPTLILTALSQRLGALLSKQKKQ